MNPLRTVECGWCHETFTTDDGRLKYCCPECAEEAHRKKCRENFRVRYHVTHREEELERKRKRYRDNPEKEQARIAEYNKKNPGWRREYRHNYYLAHKEATAQ